MSDLKTLSADAFNVMHAATNGNVHLIGDPVYRQCVANGIRAAVDAVLPPDACFEMEDIYVRLKFLSLAKMLTSAHEGEHLPASETTATEGS
jgi:hypothetical protein